ncbi:hypothetical protein SO802_025227 [Lithocarpus litseifolius]|uniref:1-aminocyclopropane-1-carboxylate oxidase n=1 Tax=Lithocarpus litseifolius TaxID=425828 RepID=A0AAW2BYM5_9ROSI
MAATDHIAATPTYDLAKEFKEFDESKMGVKGLADSGITSIPKMFIHPPEIISNDNYVSVEHRVLAKASKEPRISAVAFFNLNNNANFEPLPELLSSDKPAIYRKSTVTEYLENYYSKGLGSRSFLKKINIVN